MPPPPPFCAFAEAAEVDNATSRAIARTALIMIPTLGPRRARIKPESLVVLGRLRDAAALVDCVDFECARYRQVNATQWHGLAGGDLGDLSAHFPLHQHVGPRQLDLAPDIVPVDEATLIIDVGVL